MKDILSMIYNICSKCLAYMQRHPTLSKWLKCVCGYSKVQVPIITIENYYMGRDVEYKDELTSDINRNAHELLDKVNALLQELEITEEFWKDLPKKVSSGWRPAEVNKNIGGGSKSAHLSAKAVDIVDTKDQKLAKLLKENTKLLKKYGLWMEDPSYTKGQYTNWVHLQTRKAYSGRIFRPY